ncbi:MAG: glycerol dehydrogenase-like iron-containing ADH family enzyme, partial [Patiriisocius sp.]
FLLAVAQTLYAFSKPIIPTAAATCAGASPNVSLGTSITDATTFRSDKKSEA